MTKSITFIENSDNIEEHIANHLLSHNVYDNRKIFLLLLNRENINILKILYILEKQDNIYTLFEYIDIIEDISKLLVLFSVLLQKKFADNNFSLDDKLEILNSKILLKINTSTNQINYSFRDFFLIFLDFNNLIISSYENILTTDKNENEPFNCVSFVLTDTYSIVFKSTDDIYYLAFDKAIINAYNPTNFLYNRHYSYSILFEEQNIEYFIELLNLDTILKIGLLDLLNNPTIDHSNLFIKYKLSKYGNNVYIMDKEENTKYFDFWLNSTISTIDKIDIINNLIITKNKDIKKEQLLFYVLKNINSLEEINDFVNIKNYLIDYITDNYIYVHHLKEKLILIELIEKFDISSFLFNNIKYIYNNSHSSMYNNLKYLLSSKIYMSHTNFLVILDYYTRDREFITYIKTLRLTYLDNRLDITLQIAYILFKNNNSLVNDVLLKLSQNNREIFFDYFLIIQKEQEFKLEIELEKFYSNNIIYINDNLLKPFLFIELYKYKLIPKIEFLLFLKETSIDNIFNNLDLVENKKDIFEVLTFDKLFILQYKLFLNKKDNYFIKLLSNNIENISIYKELLTILLGTKSYFHNEKLFLEVFVQLIEYEKGIANLLILIDNAKLFNIDINEDITSKYYHIFSTDLEDLFS
jgi:hypothetical protein